MTLRIITSTRLIRKDEGDMAGLEHDEVVVSMGKITAVHDNNSHSIKRSFPQADEKYFPLLHLIATITRH